MAGSRVPAAVLFVLGTAVTVYLAAGLLEGSLHVSGLVLGLLLFASPLEAAGVFLWVKAGAERRELRRLDIQRTVLGLVETQGEVSIPSLCTQLGISTDALKRCLYDLVALGVFTGYVDWKAKRLISQEAKSLGTNACPACGAAVALAGKGIVKCEYCGAEIFLSPESQNG